MGATACNGNGATLNVSSRARVTSPVTQQEVAEMDGRMALRPAEVAQTLGIGRSKTYELLASGAIPSVRIGSSIRVPVDALNAWMREQLERSAAK